MRYQIPIRFVSFTVLWMKNLWYTIHKILIYFKAFITENENIST